MAKTKILIPRYSRFYRSQGTPLGIADRKTTVGAWNYHGVRTHGLDTTFKFFAPDSMKQQFLDLFGASVVSTRDTSAAWGETPGSVEFRVKDVWVWKSKDEMRAIPNHLVSVI